MLAIIDAQFNIVMLILTTIYVVSTLLLLRISLKANKLSNLAVEEMQKQRKLELRPYVSFDAYRDKSGNCFFKLENTGKTHAFNVKLTMDKPLQILETQNPENKKLKDVTLSMFNTIPLLTPNNPYIEFVTHLRFFDQDFDRDEAITGKFVYESHDKTKYEYKIAFDLKMISRTFVDDTRLVSSDAELIGNTISDALTKIETQLRMHR